MKSIPLFRACAILFIAAGLALPAQAGEIESIAEAINKAGRQRMLSQQMVKNYCLLGVDPSNQGAQTDLSEGIATFNRQLAELQGFALTKKLKSRSSKVVSVWQPF